MTPRDPVVTLRGQCFGHGRLAGVGVGFDGDDADSAFGEEFQAHVAAAFGPFVALFGQDGLDLADQGGAGRGRCPRRRCVGGSLCSIAPGGYYSRFGARSRGVGCGRRAARHGRRRGARPCRGTCPLARPRRGRIGMHGRSVGLVEDDADLGGHVGLRTRWGLW